MRRKHAALVVYDWAVLLVVALVAVTAFPAQAYAYVDPSVMTYTIQALAGVAVALSAVLGVALRRTRKVLMRALHIDENAHKQVEPMVHRVDGSNKGGVDLLATADKSARRCHEEQVADSQARKLSWPQRFIRSMIAALFLIGTVFIVAPLEVVSGSASSLVFGPGDVATLVICAGVASSVLLALLVSITRGRAFDVVIAVIVALGLCCYVQAMFLNNSLPIADGHALDLSSYKTITVISAILWAVVIVGSLALNRYKVRLWRAASMGLCFFLIIVQGVGVIGAIASPSTHPKDIVVTEEGLFDVGSRGNVVVFVLDTFDTQEVDRLLIEEPGLFGEFTGFTYFRNSVGSMVPTRYGIPFLLTGVLPDDSQGFNEFIDSWYTSSTLLPDLADAGYDIGVYSDSIESSYLGMRDIEGIEFVAEYASNVQDQGAITLDPLGTLFVLDKVALYRDVPWLLKPLFWFYTDDVNSGAISKDKADATPYAIDDAAYSEELFSRGLSADTVENAFRFIHLNGAHIPYVIGKDGHENPVGSTLDDQSIGSIAIVDEYLRQMKKLGVYDDATIIVTADHGDWYLTSDELRGPTTPVLLVKPAESNEEAAAPLKVSMVPTGHLDYAATLVDAVGGDSSAYGPTVFEVQEGPRLRYYWMTTSSGYDDQELKEYVIDGSVLDFDNWRLTGREVKVQQG